MYVCVCYFEEGVAVCFDYFLLEGDDLRWGGLAGTSLTGDSQTRAKRHRDKIYKAVDASMSASKKEEGGGLFHIDRYSQPLSLTDTHTEENTHHLAQLNGGGSD